eukprot:CAMPEP_0203752728 /NCGR_PEP_ID=MMETSP0098-20131031/6601_1 /ASSEMBLY_ACC=CAM_ASM_000208 /TAXON_ID=96639 /ORGANISM=" , Strain NY0313808BC1" /LENGTH=237 /DNA_ID=CAMNT_0050643021 /DNA_START=276 /DNA_END=986 /DNA_ORIENTATION=-
MVECKPAPDAILRLENEANELRKRMRMARILGELRKAQAYSNLLIHTGEQRLKMFELYNRDVDTALFDLAETYHAAGSIRRLRLQDGTTENVKQKVYVREIKEFYGSALEIQQRLLNAKTKQLGLETETSFDKNKTLATYRSAVSKTLNSLSVLHQYVGSDDCSKDLHYESLVLAACAPVKSGNQLISYNTDKDEWNVVSTELRPVVRKAGIMKMLLCFKPKLSRGKLSKINLFLKH